MVQQIVFQGNLNPAAPNISSRFTDAIAFYIAAPLINVELEIDVYLQVYYPSLTDEQVRNIPLARVTEQSILLNKTDTETSLFIPDEYLDTGLEMALLFLSSDSTFIQVAIAKKNCYLTDICNEVRLLNTEITNIKSTLSILNNKLNLVLANLGVSPIPTTPPTTAQQAFFFLQ